jgi:hypothetical protein
MSDTPYTQGFRAGQEAEQKRILELLRKDLMISSLDEKKMDEGIHWVIALIKGEV